MLVRIETDYTKKVSFQDTYCNSYKRAVGLNVLFRYNFQIVK